MAHPCVGLAKSTLPAAWTGSPSAAHVAPPSVDHTLPVPTAHNAPLAADGDSGEPHRLPKDLAAPRGAAVGARDDAAGAARAALVHRADADDARSTRRDVPDVVVPAHVDGPPVVAAVRGAREAIELPARPAAPP